MYNLGTHAFKDILADKIGDKVSKVSSKKPSFFTRNKQKQIQKLNEDDKKKALLFGVDNAKVKRNSSLNGINIDEQENLICIMEIKYEYNDIIDVYGDDDLDYMLSDELILNTIYDRMCSELNYVMEYTNNDYTLHEIFKFDVIDGLKYAQNSKNTFIIKISLNIVGETQLNKHELLEQFRRTLQSISNKNKYNNISNNNNNNNDINDNTTWSTKLKWISKINTIFFKSFLN